MPTRKIAIKGFFMLLFAFSCFSVQAQIFWTETFDGTGCGGSGCSPSIVSWVVTPTGTNGGVANEWYVSDTESGLAPPSCGAANQNDQSLHIGNVATSSAAFFFCPTGDCGAAYDDSSPNEATDIRAASPTIDCSGKTNISADFNYLENGQGSMDNATFWYFDGTTWAQLDPIVKSSIGCAPQGQWTAVASISLPASADNNPNVKVGFRWVNNGDGLASDPSFAVDDVTLCSNCIVPLSVELFDFKANQIENSIVLDWKTATELNNDYFTVEKSINGKKWSFVSKVDGFGTSNIKHFYQAKDNRPYPSISYYRLKQTDMNGEFTYSKIISINAHSSNAELIYPQPAKEQFTLVTSKKYNSISFWNTLGERIPIAFVTDNNRITFNTSNLPNGIYFLHLSNKGGNQVKKIMIQ